MAKNSSHTETVDDTTTDDDSPTVPTSKRSSGKGRRSSRPTNTKAPKEKSQRSPQHAKVSTGNGNASRNQRPFPALPIEDALKIPHVIRVKNNGNDWDTDQVASALNMGPKGNKFFYHASASRDYGLTTGSRDTDRIGLTQAGKAVFFAGDESTKRKG